MTAKLSWAMVDGVFRSVKDFERTEAEAKRRGAALLRRWANDLEAPRDLSGGDPKLCSYCGHPTSSSTCQVAVEAYRRTKDVRCSCQLEAGDSPCKIHGEDDE